MQYKVTVEMLGIVHETTITTERGPNELRTAIENLNESSASPAWKMRLT